MSALLRNPPNPEPPSRPPPASTEGPPSAPSRGSGKEPLRVCINTQTPLLQFLLPPDGSTPRWELVASLGRLEEGVDYRFSPGGVTRMVYPLVQRLLARNVWREVHWVSLNPGAPEEVRLQQGITLHHIALDRDRLAGYGHTKEAIWSTLHGVDSRRTTQDLFWTDDYGEYTHYNRRTAELMRKIDRTVDFDAFYVHDFQQLPVGHMLGTLKPKLFRWHIPFDVRKVPAQWRPLVLTYFGAYDLVIVSADRYRASLTRFGHAGRVVCLPPFVDAGEYRRGNPSEVAEVCRRFSIGPDVIVALVVARMEPSKAQDRAIDVLARLARRFPRLRLVLAGNGSFSGTRAGLGKSRAASWRHSLEERARLRGVSDRVVLTGHVSQHELECLYERCAFTILPSIREGFGLVVVESWLFGKPAVISRRAGISDLVEDGANGLLFDPDRPRELDRALELLLKDRGPLRQRLAEGGARTARSCSLEAAVQGEARLLAELVAE